MESTDTARGTRSRRRMAVLAMIAAAGLLLITIGGYGPCGPASWCARVGASLGYDHFVFLCTLAPPFEAWLAGVDCMPLNVAAAFLVSILDWSIVTFVILTVWVTIRRRSGRQAAR